MMDIFIAKWKRNVWLTTGGDNSPRTPPGTPCKSRISPKQNHPRTMDTQNKKNMLHISCWQLCNQIHKIGRRTSSNQSSQKGLQHISWLGRNKIHRTYHRVGLHKPQSTRTHARILVKSPTMIQSSATKEKAELTIPTCCTPIWSKNSIHTRCWRLPPLNKEETKYIQVVTGTLLYYGRAVDNTILPALSAIVTKQAEPMEKTKDTIKQMLDYCASQEEAIISYSASKMILAVHSNAGYCNEKKSQSQPGGHIFLTNDAKHPTNNGAILMIATIIKAVMTSAAEAELGALYLNAQEVVYLWQILNKMGHPQPQTPIQTNNLMAEGVINSKIQPKRTKAMDMRFHWLQDWEAQD